MTRKIRAFTIPSVRSAGNKAGGLREQSGQAAEVEPGPWSDPEGCGVVSIKKKRRNLLIPPLFDVRRRAPVPHGLLNTLSFHGESRRSEPSPFQEHIEVYPFEHELGDVVHLRVSQQAKRSYERQRICSGVWLSAVVEVDDIGFPEA